MAKHAIVRPPSKTFKKCISSHPEHHKLNLTLALNQHHRYIMTIKELGLDVIQMEPMDTLHDACFVEDTVVLHGNKALITRPQPKSRRGEVESVREVLKDYFEISQLKEPATLEGGDVIHFKNHLICGITQRTSALGVQQMSDALDVRVENVEDVNIVHLKSYVTSLDENTVVGIDRYSQHPVFSGVKFISIPDSESYASNTLTINGTVIIPYRFPETKKILKASEFDVIQLDTSEFAKCEGALTCLSIIF